MNEQVLIVFDDDKETKKFAGVGWRFLLFFFQAEDGIRDIGVTGVQTCALPIYTFEVMPADIPEPTEALFGDCRQFVQQVAWMKAAAVAPKIDAGVILSADTVGWQIGRASCRERV